MPNRKACSREIFSSQLCATRNHKSSQSTPILSFPTLGSYSNKEVDFHSCMYSMSLYEMKLYLHPSHSIITYVTNKKTFRGFSRTSVKINQLSRYSPLPHPLPPPLNPVHPDPNSFPCFQKDTREPSRKIRSIEIKNTLSPSLGSITSRCSGNEPTLIPEETAGRVN